MTRSYADKIRSWLDGLKMAGFTEEQAIQKIAEAIFDEMKAIAGGSHVA